MKLEDYKKLDRYILAKYLKTFILALALIIIIVITFDVSEKLDDFLNHHAPIKEIIFGYYLNFIPSFVNLYSPLFIFISVIFFTSKMAGNTEIIAILGSGISYKRMLRPFLHGSIIIALLVFVLGNFVIPISNQRLIAFDKQYIHTRHANYYANIHLQTSPSTQLYTESYDVQQGQATRFHHDTYDSLGKMVERMSADRIVYDSASGEWTCYGYVHRAINEESERLTRMAVKRMKMDFTPADFDQESTHIEVMNSIRLYRYIVREKMKGSQAVITAQIELYQRILNPLAIIIMTLIGVAVSSKKSRGGIGVPLAIGITLAFGFVVFMKISTVFATNGNLLPFLAVLLPQATFGVAAVVLIKRAPK